MGARTHRTQCNNKVLAMADAVLRGQQNALPLQTAANAFSGTTMVSPGWKRGAQAIPQSKGRSLWPTPSRRLGFTKLACLLAT